MEGDHFRIGDRIAWTTNPREIREVVAVEGRWLRVWVVRSDVWEVGDVRLAAVRSFVRCNYYDDDPNGQER